MHYSFNLFCTVTSTHIL